MRRKHVFVVTRDPIPTVEVDPKHRSCSRGVVSRQQGRTQRVPATHCCFQFRQLEPNERPCDPACATHHYRQWKCVPCKQSSAITCAGATGRRVPRRGGGRYQTQLLCKVPVEVERQRANAEPEDSRNIWASSTVQCGWACVRRKNSENKHCRVGVGIAGEWEGVYFWDWG